MHTVTVYDPSSSYSVAAIPLHRIIGEFIPMGYTDNIAALRKKRGLTQSQLAEQLEVQQPTVQRWETGKREPSMTDLAAIAAALGVTPGDLFGDITVVPIGPTLSVKGEVAAGVWREAVEQPEDEWQTFTGRSDVNAKLEHRFGLRIVGDSMSLLYPPGTIIECVSTFGKCEASPGKRVVVIRRNTDGLCEATVKELVKDDDGRLWAVPRSANPAHRAISLDTSEPGIKETRIAAVVVASYRPE